MSFYPGQLVECIVAFHQYEGETAPIKGHIYTVRGVLKSQRTRITKTIGDGLYLEEIINEPKTYIGFFGEAAFDITCFRPITDSKLAVFRRLLIDIPVDEKERV